MELCANKIIISSYYYFIKIVDNGSESILRQCHEANLLLSADSTSYTSPLINEVIFLHLIGQVNYLFTAVIFHSYFSFVCVCVCLFSYLYMK